MKIIAYGTEYGHTRRYAEELSRRTGIECVSFDAVEDVDAYDTIIFLGSIYSGSVLGMRPLFSRLTSFEGKTFVIATVGLADPNDEANTAQLKFELKMKLPEEVYKTVHFFQLRGGIDYSALSFKHKTVMGLAVRKAKKVPADQRGADLQAIIETHNKKADFIDFASLDPIIEVINA